MLGMCLAHNKESCSMIDEFLLHPPFWNKEEALLFHFHSPLRGPCLLLLKIYIYLILRCYSFGLEPLPIG